MHAATELTLFKKKPAPRLAPFRMVEVLVPAVEENPAQSEMNTLLQKLMVMIQQEILTVFPGKKFSKDLLKCLQKTNDIELDTISNLNEKTACLFALIESLEQLEACLQHKKDYALFLNHSSVQRLKDSTFKMSVKNLKNELDSAMSVSPVAAELLHDFGTRADLIKNTMLAFQNYTLEFKERRLLSAEHNKAEFAEIDRLAGEIVEDIKVAIKNYSNDIPFFERCLKLLLDDGNASMNPRRKPFMRYESAAVGWFSSSVEFKNPEFYEDVLQERLASLFLSLHREFQREGLKLVEKITKFAIAKQFLVQEIDARLQMLNVFIEEPKMLPEQANGFSHRPN